MRNVIARVQRGARYTETPPAPGRLAPLDAFLFRDRAGYCQHFAGAMALLLRMGGVPAAVAAGFSPGSRDARGEHIVRDLDAHCWVEAYFPGIGWVTFDPTPADSPARSQQTDTRSPRRRHADAQRAAAPAGDRASDPTAGGAGRVVAARGPTGRRCSPLAAVARRPARLAGVAAGAARRRRRRAAAIPSSSELRLALAAPAARRPRT